MLYKYKRVEDNIFLTPDIIQMYIIKMNDSRILRFSFLEVLVFIRLGSNLLTK